MISKISEKLASNKYMSLSVENCLERAKLIVLNINIISKDQ